MRLVFTVAFVHSMRSHLCWPGLLRILSVTLRAGAPVAGPVIRYLPLIVLRSSFLQICIPLPELAIAVLVWIIFIGSLIISSISVSVVLCRWTLD